MPLGFMANADMNDIREMTSICTQTASEALSGVFPQGADQQATAILTVGLMYLALEGSNRYVMQAIEKEVQKKYPPPRLPDFPGGD